MGENTAIEWADHSFSPWWGCQAVSPGCMNCYAKALVERWGGDFATRRRTSIATWRKVYGWNKDAARTGRRLRVFPSMCDPFDNKVPEPWRADYWDLVHDTPYLDHLILTKRPQNIAGMLPVPLAEFPERFPNVWLGVSTENQEEAGRRIRILVTIPATVHFLSAEPLLGPIDLGIAGAHLGYGIQWVIGGGESGGPKKRRVNIAHMRDLRDQCVASGIAWFGKQDDKIHALPDDLMIREFPRTRNDT